MKLQTENVKENVKIVNILVILSFIIGLIFCYLDVRFFRDYDEILVLVSIIILLYLSYLGAPYFKYDSEGETLVLQNTKALPFSLVKAVSSDFPKRKLVDFKIVKRMLGKKNLEIYITSKRVEMRKTKISFDISYLNSKNIRDLNISLTKLVKENQINN